MLLKTIYLNAGHDIVRDPGTVTRFGREIDFNIKIRDALIPQLRGQGFKVVSVPDTLGLGKSYKFVNKYTNNINDGLALSIHCNSFKRGEAEGAETFYYKNNLISRGIAKKLIDAYCEETGLKNRGAKSDTLSKAKLLAWIRKTNVWSTLIEVGFIDNVFDVQKLENIERVARGICKGVNEIYGIKYVEEVPQPESKGRENIKKEIIKLVNQL